MKIVCPNCHKLLTVAAQPGIEDKTLICPVCQFKAKVSVFMNASSASAHGTGSEDTVLPGSWGGVTPPPPPVKRSAGRFRIVQTNQFIELKPGHHSIGRSSNPARASIMIGSPVYSDPYMSRCHVELDIISSPAGQQHRLKDLGKNTTKLNGKEIPQGSIVILKFGDKITLGQTDLILEDNDQEATRVAP